MKATLLYSSALAAAIVLLPSCTCQRAHRAAQAPAPQCCVPAIYSPVHVYSNTESSEVVQKQLAAKRKMLQETQADSEAERVEHTFVQSAAPDLYANQDYQWLHNQILTDNARKAKELSTDISNLSNGR